MNLPLDSRPCNRAVSGNSRDDEIFSALLPVNGATREAAARSRVKGGTGEKKGRERNRVDAASREEDRRSLFLVILIAARINRTYLSAKVQHSLARMSVRICVLHTDPEMSDEKILRESVA